MKLLQTAYVVAAALVVLTSGCVLAQTEKIQSFNISIDSIFWVAPQYSATGSFAFSELDPESRIRLPFSIDKSVNLILTDRRDSITFHSPSGLERSTHRVEIIRNELKKNINIIFVPPFSPQFSDSYNYRKSGSIRFENPEVYELVNIAFSITEKGSKDRMTFDLESDYYNDVLKHFGQYTNHPLIKLLNKDYFPGSSEYRMYRESAYNYAFKDGIIQPYGPYKNFEEGNTVLDYPGLWEDFAKRSRFRDFYNDHRIYYQSQIDRAKKFLPVKKMWRWLENRFPDRYNTYVIVISPLVHGFHSTQRIQSEGFSECIMFLCGASKVVSGAGHAQNEVAYSGLLFTESDHNYVNPVSEKYKAELDKVFGTGEWVRSNSQGAAYGSGTGYFNEYLTHAVYLLYVADNYPKDNLAAEVESRTQLMHTRGFPRFAEFYGELMRICREEGIEGDLTKVYPHLLKWAEVKLKAKD